MNAHATFSSVDYYDAVLDLWAEGVTAADIARKLGEPLTAHRVSSIAKVGRRRDDPRAAPRKQGGNQPSGSVWTPVMRQRVAGLVEDGLSIRAIAAEVGFTPQQVSGYVSRAGLVMAREAIGGRARVGVEKQPRKERPRPTFSTSFKRRPFPKPKAVVVVVPPAPPVVAPPPAPTHRIGIVDLTEAMCKFPIGHPRSPDFTFCGSARVSGRPYCPGHLRLAYYKREAA